MSTQVWSYTPHGMMAETLAGTVPVINHTGIPYVGLHERALVRAFRCDYSQVTSSEVRSMAAFYRTHRGAYEAFHFYSHLGDEAIWGARFDNDLRLEHFTVNYFRTSPLIFHVIPQSGGVIAPVLGWGWGGGGSGGIGWGGGGSGGFGWGGGVW